MHVLLQLGIPRAFQIHLFLLIKVDPFFVDYEWPSGDLSADGIEVFLQKTQKTLTRHRRQKSAASGTNPLSVASKPTSVVREILDDIM
jgi:hypothetical protein